eukprot:CAMPEP_0170127958 /NCGR_PEP_ID=MMETSP0020_2-20130122/20829_1 /TAXON_ID=98059 /ORGANISM="Dinobryon sp., Strain UTEXLB2267" /LENGTH=243 /DNA_ID=CAMNT_0010361675 /DNA_START=221 /DNA_END=948 /DNA_ORIENTATION=-
MDNWLGCQSQSDRKSQDENDSRFHQTFESSSQQCYNQTTRLGKLSGGNIQVFNGFQEEGLDPDLRELCEIILSDDDYSSNDWNHTKDMGSDECILFAAPLDSPLNFMDGLGFDDTYRCDFKRNRSTLNGMMPTALTATHSTSNTDDTVPAATAINGNENSLSPSELQRVFDDLVSRPTDPIGKFLKETNLTAEEAIQLNIQHHLLYAPKKQRTKYGKRVALTADERAALCRQRNREHAKATRL